MRNPGAKAERPISTGRRGLVCSDFFGFGGVAVAGTDFEPSRKSEAAQINAFIRYSGPGFPSAFWAMLSLDRM
jgi:hypothetical protein